MTELKLAAIITAKPDGIDVEVVVVNSDLDFRFSWGLKSTHHGLAHRLKKAVDAGVVFKNVRVATDIHGKEYVTGDCQILSRLMNAELKRLGF